MTTRFFTLVAVNGFLALTYALNLPALADDRPEQDAALAAELISMGELDQKYRTQMQNLLGKQLEPGSNESKEFLSLSETQAELDQKNLARLEQIVGQKGWPGIHRVGTKAAQAAFLIVQHADLDAQIKYLPVLKSAAADGNVRASDLALLEDRVLMRQGKPQIYGSQLYSNSSTGGSLKLHTIDDEPYVDARRKRVGLAPLSEYVKRFRLEYVESNQLFEPIWKGDTVYGESALLLQDAKDSAYVARLAFPAEQLIAVRTSNREKTIPIDQIEIGDGGYEIRIPCSPDLIGLQRDELYRTPDSPNSYRHRVGHPEQWLLYGPARYFHDRQIEITYKRKTTLLQNEPVYASVSLPRTTQLLKEGRPLSIGVSGDSISTGLDASGSCQAEPNQPGYVDLVAQKLRRVSKASIEVHNRSVAGWSVANGLQDVDNLLQLKPNLIVIAYGMNDVGRKDPAWFGKHIDQMLGKIHAVDSTIEVILVSSMVGNEEWIHTPREMFEPYRDELKKRIGSGVALADVTSMWMELLKHKHDLDLTGNGLNHPNDFGHRVYAQTILALLVE